MLFVTIWIKFFFLLTPFFALSMFLAITEDFTEKERVKLALKTTLAVTIISFTLLFFGNFIFSVFGITVDAFKIGAGGLLFLSAVSLVQGNKSNKDNTANPDSDNDISVVPLGIPTIVGPATIGTLLVMGTELKTTEDKIFGCLALFTAVVCVGVILIISSYIERAIKKKGITILSKVTGLILAALASQMIFSGIRGFLVL